MRHTIGVFRLDQPKHWTETLDWRIGWASGTRTHHGPSGPKHLHLISRTEKQSRFLKAITHFSCVWELWFYGKDTEIGGRSGKWRPFHQVFLLSSTQPCWGQGKINGSFYFVSFKLFITTDENNSLIPLSNTIISTLLQGCDRCLTGNQQRRIP